jgi:hypothetical protein
MDHEMAKHALAHESGSKAKKHLKEMHIRELHDGTHHVAMHDGKGGPPKEASASDLDHVHDLMEEHMGQPNEGEQEVAAQPEPEPQGM